MLIANARLYALNPEVEGLWQQLMQAVLAQADIPARYEPYAAPQPLHALWRRADLACALICGYPWATWDPAVDGPRPLALAAPCPAGEGGLSQYRSDIVVPLASPYHSLAALYGQRMAYTVEHSQSGYQSLRSLLARAAAARPLGRCFEATLGPLVTPRALVQALLQGAADAAPLDGYWHALLRLHEPALAAQLRVVAHTPATAMPLLVCSGQRSDAQQQRLARAWLDAHKQPACQPLLAALCLEGFAAVQEAPYQALAAAAALADGLGYTRLA